MISLARRIAPVALPLLVCAMLWASWPLAADLTWMLLASLVFVLALTTGWRGGLLASLLCAALGSWLIQQGSADPAQTRLLWSAAGFLVVTLGTCALCWRWRRSMDQAATRQADARQLAQRDVQYRLLFQNSMDAIIQGTANGEILAANQAACRMFALSEAEICHLGRMGIIDSSDPRLAPMQQQRVETGHSQGALRMRRGDGSTFEADILSSLYQDASGRTMVNTVIRDITERLQAQARLRASEIRLAGVIESAMDAIIMVDEHQRILSLNPAARILFRCSDAQALGQPIHCLIPERFASAHSAHVQRFVDSGQTNRRMGLRASVLGRRWDGEEFPAEASIAHIQVGGERLMVAILSDVSENRRAEHQLKQSHELLHKLSQQVPGALFQLTLNPAGHFALPFASGGLRDMFGLLPGLVADDTEALFSAVAPDDQRAVIDSLHRSANSLEDWALVFRVQHPDGSLRWRQGQARPERMADGSTIWHGFMSDATESVEAKARLEQSNETLESQVAQRTQELMLALQQAQLAMRSRGDFLAKMSHEIRTPMNTILGMAYLALKATPPDSRSHGYLRRIEAAGRHLLHIIEEILDFSKIDAGKVVLDQEDFDLDQMVRSITDLIESRASEQGLRVQVRVDEDVPRGLHGDPLRLSQVLINFMNNAVKFTTNGVIELRVHVQQEPEPPDSEPGCRLRFEVEDTGPGIDQEQQSRLFQPFEQGDNSITRQYGGSGLGLVISKQLVQLMNGDIGVRSQPGVGSTFWCTVWLRLAGDTDAAVSAVPPADDGAELPVDTAVLFGARVLVVDDNPFNCEVALAMLEGVGVQVSIAEDGAQALDMLHQESFDAVLMDVQMPELDGLEATRRLRREPKLAAVRVIALTANALAEDQRRCREAGMDDVLTKPVEPDRLFATLARWLLPAAGARGIHAENLGSDAGPPPPVEPHRHADVQAATVWDRGALSQAVGDNPLTHQRLLEKFLSTARTQVSVIQQALAQRQARPAADAAHKLKSAARAVGALELGDCCETIERAGRVDKLEDGEELMAQMLQKFSRCEADIQAWLRAFTERRHNLPNK